MPINFPANSVIDDVYTYNDVNFIYDGQRWKTRNKPVHVGTVEPLNPYTGDMFFDTSINTLSIFDGTEWQYFNTTQSIVYPDVNGEQAYTSPGTYSWTCPSDVNFVHAVCVGGGGGGDASTGNMGAGGGGGLSWRNDIAVTPGNTYTVVVGTGGLGGVSPSSGGLSYFIDSNTCIAYGGVRAADLSGGLGGGFYPFGGSGGSGGNNINNTNGGGGGGGGYSGNGGSGGSNSNGGAGTGGGGGGGGAGGNARTGGGGGGVGIYGSGNSGSGGVFSTSFGGSGGGGSGGAAGSGQSGGIYGAGGGGSGSSSYAAGNGGGGAVRIIWGPNRGFPSTNTGVL